jgi:hypothetical protein
MRALNKHFRRPGGRSPPGRRRRSRSAAATCTSSPTRSGHGARTSCRRSSRSLGPPRRRRAYIVDRSRDWFVDAEGAADRGHVRRARWRRGGEPRGRGRRGADHALEWREQVHGDEGQRRARGRLATTADPSTVDGGYFERLDRKELRGAQASDPDLAGRLWERSAELTGLSSSTSRS